MQLDALREYATRRGYLIVEEFVDHGVSGTKTTRPALDRLLDAAHKRKLDAVLVYKFDRFARSTIFLVKALEEFNTLGIDFVSYTENLDTGTGMGKAMFTIIAALATLERDLIVERSAEGQRRARARGVQIGRPRVEVDQEEIRFLRSRGLSIRAIADQLQVSKSVVGRLLPRT
ncbi:MAG: recombinase family protein [Planctomycetes bacterium]|nr:recombinase family protein [Planctomycetota bacterium]